VAGDREEWKSVRDGRRRSAQLTGVDEAYYLYSLLTP
jgi:hypothetical protein